jgi:hypothetical protein
VQYPPPDALEPDLKQSIENWKDDWATLRRKRAARAAAASSLYDAAGGVDAENYVHNVMDAGLVDGTGDRDVTGASESFVSEWAAQNPPTRSRS